jgi:UDP-glucose/iron transport system ATP-binding protein
LNDLILQVDHLSLAYPGRRGDPVPSILEDVSFAVERGRALTLMGPSGSGKSSLLRCLNRLVEPTSGTVRFDGRDIQSIEPRHLRRQVALVMQTPVLFEGTVRDNLRVRPAGASGDFSEGRLGVALAEVGLELDLLDRDAAMLSGGEKQRVTIARALLRDPQALLLDEPTSALDPPNALLVVETISRLCLARSLSIVAVTHQPDLVRRLGGGLLYLVRGRVEAFESFELQGDLRARADEVEARLALGFSGREAVQPMVRAALRAAMIPTVNGMMTVGLVQLPGMMTGQILAGSSPLVAIRYQMVVVFMLAAATALASLLFVRLAATRYLTAAHQLRRYLL